MSIVRQTGQPQSVNHGIAARRLIRLGPGLAVVPAVLARLSGAIGLIERVNARTWAAKVCTVAAGGLRRVV